MKPYQMLNVLVKTAMLLAAALAASQAASFDSSGADAAAMSALANGAAALGSSLLLLGCTAAWLFKVEAAAEGAKDEAKDEAKDVAKDDGTGKDVASPLTVGAVAPAAAAAAPATATAGLGPTHEFLPCPVAVVNRWKCATFAAAAVSAGLSIWLAARPWADEDATGAGCVGVVCMQVQSLGKTCPTNPIIMIVHMLPFRARCP